MTTLNSETSKIFKNISFWIQLLNDRKNLIPFAIFLVLGELILNLLIINKVPYTEIDWNAYMEQVGSVTKGIYDYSKLKGGTGPIVYPAGFVYVYWFLYQITDEGKNIILAQYIFLILYLAMIFVLFLIYFHSKEVPPWILILLCVSYRVHSIFVLRLFNDCVAVFFLYISILALLRNHWSLGCFLYSLAVSVKMNILLYAPGLVVLLLKRFGLRNTIPKLILCAVVQVGLGLPFLLESPWSYISRAFNLGRKFLFIWTVNWKFVPEEIFVSWSFAVILLGLTILFWGLFLKLRWLKSETVKIFLFEVFHVQTQQHKQLESDYIISVLFESNFVGIVFSRTLHFQFYVWYYHTLPYLLWRISLATETRMTLLIVIEMMWNVFPTQAVSSLILQFCHFFILFALLFIPKPKTNDNVKRPSLWKLLFYVGVVTLLMVWTFGPKILKITQKFIALNTKDEL